MVNSWILNLTWRNVRGTLTNRQKGFLLTAAIQRTVMFPEISMERLKSMLGAYNGHIKQIEQRLDVKISHRGDAFYLDGSIETVERAEALLQRLFIGSIQN